MKRAQLNYGVDAATGIAFLVCAVTGILFLLPPGVHQRPRPGHAGHARRPLPAWH